MNNKPDEEDVNSDGVVPLYPVSPVPGDESLTDYELPFTAFGQFGEGSLDCRVFEQDKYWVNREGTPFLLDEMERDYLMNVVAFLFENAEYYHWMMVRKLAIEVLYDSLTGKANPDVLAIQTNNSIVNLSSMEWLSSTPLMRKLQRLLD